MTIVRRRLQNRVEGGGNYFAEPKKNLEFIHSGSTVLDLVMGGGWPENRISNIVGDKSTGKTLLCIEAACNFARKYEKGRILYREAEAAFDPEYAAALGMPLNRVDFGAQPLETVEDMFEDLTRQIERAKPGRPILYILDSLDALSDRGELARGIDEGTYGAAKAKKMSETLRRLKGRIAASHLTFLVVSQIRDNINATFMQRKTKRSGGHALDFYASVVIYLHQVRRIPKTIKRIEKVVGVEIRAMCEKNKIDKPFREAQFPIIFGYGINDEDSMIRYLEKEALVKVPQFGDLREIVQREWYRIEKSFLPTRRKYA